MRARWWYVCLCAMAARSARVGAAEPASYLHRADLWSSHAEHAQLFDGGRTLACPKPSRVDLARWEFGEADDTWPLTFVGPNVKDLRVQNGRLTFRAGAKELRLGWGNCEPGTSRALKSLQVDGDHYNTADFTVRLRQSQAPTTWTFDCRYRGDPLDAGFWSGNLTQKSRTRGVRVPTSSAVAGTAGDEWQTVTTRFHRIADADGIGLVIATEPGNHIEIDFLRIGFLNASIYARKTFEVPDGQVFSAKATVSTALSVYVNRHPVRESTHQDVGTTRYDLVSIDFAEHIEPGRTNTIAVAEKSWKVSTPVCWLAGAVQMEDGTALRLGTGLDWRCSTEPEPGWLGAGFDDTTWRAPGDKDPTGFLKGAMPPFFDYNSARIPVYTGQIELTNPGGAKFFYDTDAGPVRFAVRLPAAVAARSPVLQYAVWNDTTAACVSHGGADRHEGHWTIDLGSNLARGVYSLVVDAARGGDSELHRQEIFVVTGTIAMPETRGETWDDGMTLTLVDSVDCTDPDDRHRFADATLYHPGAEFASRVVTRNGLTYREAAVADTHNQRGWLGWWLTFEHVDRPHYVVIDYPDDLPRRMDIEIHPRHLMRTTWQSHYDHANAWVSAGIQSGGKYPCTGRMMQHRFIVWSHEREASILLTRASERACRRDGEELNAKTAVAKVRIYEIDRLPAVRTTPFPGGRRMGIVNERESVMRQSYAAGIEARQGHFVPGQNPYVEWFGMAERYAQYCRFIGLNAHFMGCYQYYYGNPPALALDTGAEGASLLPDLRDMIVNVLGANGIMTYSSLEYRADKRRWGDGWPALHQVLENGADLMFHVDKDGGCQGGAYQRENPMTSTRAFEAMADAVGHIVKRFAIYPTWKGVSYILAPTWEGPCYDGWQVSFDDRTMELFEQETGIVVPVRDTTSARFGKRHAWIMDAPAVKRAWADFRSRKMFEAHQRLARRFRHVREDLEYHVILEILQDDYGDQIAAQGLSVADIFRKYGYDPEAYRHSEHVTLGRDVWSCDFAAVLAERSGINHWGWARDPQVLALLNRGTGPYRTVLVRTGFNEWMITDLSYDRAPKWFGGYFLGHVWPVHRYTTERLVHLLIDRDVDTIEYGFNDLLMNAGNEHELRRFVRTFVALPRTRFAPLTGNGRDRNICVKTAEVRGEQYLLVINPGWWSADVVLTLRGGLPLSDAVTGTSLQPDARGQLPLSLSAYDVRCLKRGGAIEVMTCRTAPSPEGLDAAAGRLADYEQVLSGKDMDDATRQATRTALREARAALDAGDLTGCWETLVSWPVHRAATQ